MNFLLHRMFAQRELDAVAGIGAMLPDLWRMADRRVRARPLDEAAVAPELVGLQRGVAHHLEADDWFHRTPVFVSGERQTRRALADIEAPKLRLFAHPVWEMCLDGAWLSRTPTASETIAAEVAAHGEDCIRLGRFHAEPSASYATRMERLLAGVADGRWIAGYMDGEGLCERLQGMRTRMGLPAFDARQARAVGAALEICATAAQDALDELERDRDIVLERGRSEHAG